VTIPYTGRCLGSGKPAREGTEETREGAATGVCVTCSGRFAIENGTIAEHETSPENEREPLDD
jgi:hypothetical protein